jgi:hypothetical protein
MKAIFLSCIGHWFVYEYFDNDVVKIIKHTMLFISLKYKLYKY